MMLLGELQTLETFIILFMCDSIRRLEHVEWWMLHLFSIGINKHPHCGEKMGNTMKTTFIESQYMNIGRKGKSKPQYSHNGFCEGRHISPSG